MDASPAISVVIPCLDEAETIGRVVERTAEALRATKLTFEVVVADNGSEDASRERAERAGARVVDASAHRGVGAATRAGAEAAQGRWLVFLDADGEHDPGELGRLLEPLASRDRCLVLGSRYRGRFLGGASSLPNRLLGTPALTLLLNHYFDLAITDCNTGFRAMPREVFEALDVTAPGFEFCSEMIVRAALLGVPIVEVPITQHPDPIGRQPHLRRWRDGWRHLILILLHAPDRVLFRPGVAALALGAAFFLPQLAGRVELGGLVMDIHLMILGALLLFIGVEMVGSAVICATMAGEPVAPQGRLSRRLGRRFHLGAVLPLAGALFSVGFACDAAVLFISASQGWQGISEPRLALVGTTGMGLGVQLAVLSFVHTVIGQYRLPRGSGEGRER